MEGRIQEANMLIFTEGPSELLSDAMNTLLIGQQIKMSTSQENQ